MAHQVLLLKNCKPAEAPLSLAQTIKESIFDMMLADAISQDVLFAISDLNERLQQISDNQVEIFSKKSITTFKGLIFNDDHEYDSVGSPYRGEFSRNVFNLIQKKVAQELKIRSIETSFINFNITSYLAFLGEKGTTLKILSKQNESLIFEWSEYFNFIGSN